MKNRYQNIMECLMPLYANGNGLVIANVQNAEVNVRQDEINR